jgi:hypothetical protein
MAYFNHAFNKMFLGTGTTLNPIAPSTNNPSSDGGFLTTSGTPTVELSKLGPGYFGFFDSKTYQLVEESDLSSRACCPLVLASSSVLSDDKIGKFHGGYLETNKSKVINPKYVRAAYAVEPCTPQQTVISIGNTPYTTSLVPANPACDFEFLCGETYYLRIDIKGSPALRYLNHNAYLTVDAYTGCCSGPTPTAVDSTLVMIAWAERILNSDILNPFVLPVVYDEATGASWFAPGTTVDPVTGLPIPAGQTWDNYVSPGHTPNQTAGIRLFGAYVDTKFGDCSFQVSDFFEKEPIKIIASLVDYTGDPCVFEGICVETECAGIQGNGFGEQVLRDLILSESYQQNNFHTDIRIREITQGDDILASINRNSLYWRYYILHSVPRFNNPTGVFDNDQYLLEIVTPTQNTSLESFIETWLGDCADCVTFETHSCSPCTLIPASVPVPVLP